MHEVLVNRLGGLSLPRKSVVRLTDRPDMTLDVYRGRKATMQQQQQIPIFSIVKFARKFVLLEISATVESQSGFKLKFRELTPKMLL